MKDVFGAEYAHTYDSLYRDKDYPAECSLLEVIFKDYSSDAVRRILDLGCGTGNHVIPFGQRGYHVVGVDRSEHMLTQARRKARNLQLEQVDFRFGDIRSINLEERFDASIMMFAVLGYQLHNTDVSSALGTARRHLRTGGLLVFDLWYGPAVLQQRPSDRVRMAEGKEGKVLRFASSELDIRHHTSTVHFHVWKLQADRLVSETSEDHTMRFFFPLELEMFLDCSGFSLIRLGAFPDFDVDPSESTWNVLGVARAV